MPGIRHTVKYKRIVLDMASLFSTGAFVLLYTFDVCSLMRSPDHHTYFVNINVFMHLEIA